MRQAWKRFYDWSHTDAGDAICAGLGMLSVMVVILAGSWVAWFLGV